jgi:catechol 2,3-dioxygenase-like lactoylglutathione lyase family enzyme
MQMSVGTLDHYNVSTRKFHETVQFYQDVLGFVNGPRPAFNFPGAWLYSLGPGCVKMAPYQRQSLARQ